MYSICKMQMKSIINNDTDEKLRAYSTLPYSQ